MHEFISYNCRVVLREEAGIAAVSSASLYGKGVFTTLAIFDGKPFLLEKHLKRLHQNALALGMESLPAEVIEKEIGRVIEVNNISEGRMRITLFDESPSGFWEYTAAKKTCLLITSADRIQNEDLNLGISPYRINSTSPINNIKSCNYLENLLALEEARSRGFHEAIRLNERNQVTSGCMANLFWVKEGKLFTPSLKTGCLAGTTREYVIENYPCIEVEELFHEFETADEFFLSSSGIGIKSVNYGKKKAKRSQIFDLLRFGK